jgi:hypothetical protein
VINAFILNFPKSFENEAVVSESPNYSTERMEDSDTFKTENCNNVCSLNKGYGVNMRVITFYQKAVTSE